MQVFNPRVALLWVWSAQWSLETETHTFVLIPRTAFPQFYHFNPVVLRMIHCFGHSECNRDINTFFFRNFLFFANYFLCDQIHACLVYNSEYEWNFKSMQQLMWLYPYQTFFSSGETIRFMLICCQVTDKGGKDFEKVFNYKRSIFFCLDFEKMIKSWKKFILLLINKKIGC